MITRTICNNCGSTDIRREQKSKEEPTPSSGNLDADFNILCGEILMGKVKEVDVKRITKEMIKAGKSEEMRKEFTRIGEILEKR